MPDTTADQVVRPFADFLREQGSGKTHEELSEALHDLIALVGDTGKAGSITLTIKVAPMKKNAEALLVSDTITKRLPTHDRKESIFYADRDGNLTRTDPKQLSFDSLREVPAVETAEPAALREARA